jgi:hypothetical protein
MLGTTAVMLTLLYFTLLYFTPLYFTLLYFTLLYFTQSFPLLPTCSQQVSRVFVISLDHIQTHTTVGRTPLDEGSARQRDLYLTTHNTVQETNIHAADGIRTDDPSKRSAADLRLRRRGRWDGPAVRHEDEW